MTVIGVAAVGTAGQRCTPTRLIIHESIYDKVKMLLLLLTSN
jgi:acyl-CoA reductase-like NAD-dependent aldehyde dehydrogenase